MEFSLDLWVNELFSDEQNDHCDDSQDDRRPVDVSDHLEQRYVRLKSQNTISILCMQKTFLFCGHLNYLFILVFFLLY